MSAFRNGYDGGFDFESASGNVRPTEDVEIMYDDMGGARRPMPQRRGGSSFSESIPQRARDNSPRYREYLPEDELEDDFDDYRPGERLVSEDKLTASYAELRRDRMSNGGFDDDFDDDGVMYDDHNAPPRRAGAKNRPQLDDYGDAYGEPRRPAQGSRLGYSRYGDDHTYSDEDYNSEFAGIRGLSAPKRAPERAPEPHPQQNGRQKQQPARSAQHAQGRPQQRPQPQRRPPQRDYDPNEGYERFDDEPDDGYNDYDGYYGHASMRDRAYEGNGVPKIFADYFHDDDDYDEYDEYNRRKRPKPIKQQLPATRIKQNARSSSKIYRRKRFTAAAVTLVAAIAALGAGIAYFTYFRSTSPLNVATALTAMESAVSDTLLKSSVDLQLAAKTVTVDVNGFKSVMSLSDCEFEFSNEEDGSEHKEWGKTVTGSDVEYTYMTRGSVKFNETKVKDFLHQAAGSEGIRMIDPDYKVDIRQDRNTKAYTGTLTITSGSNGYGIDFDTFIRALLDRISTDSFTPIECELTDTIAPAVDINKIYGDVHTTAADAYKVTDGSGTVTYEKETIGVDFDRNAASDKIAAGGTEWVINLALTIPEISKKALMAESFPDLLATYTTTFNAGNQARSSNLALAGDYINGTILQPGDVFSYNKTVGERTKERGFCKATVYSSEGTDEDYGGGICQTSSTLFYCAMKANLELVKRVNHMYTVSYMVDEKGQQCFGNDATVNWGTADMQFRNNKEYPIKLEAVSKPGSITFNIWGTWDGYTAEYRYVEKAVERYKLIYRKYKEGKKNQAGELGRTIWTYRVIFYQEDPNVGEKEEVDRYREFESVYRPLSQVKYVTSPPAGCEFDVQY